MKRPMKTITKLALMGLATAILATGSALANDWEWATFQEGNSTVTYRRPVQNQTTVAVKANDAKLHVYRFQTANGQVSYLAPAE
jgi:hypothetical protein